MKQLNKVQKKTIKQVIIIKILKHTQYTKSIKKTLLKSYQGGSGHWTENFTGTKFYSHFILIVDSKTLGTFTEILTSSDQTFQPIILNYRKLSLGTHCLIP